CRRSPGVALVFIPSLVSRFRAAEQEQGPLTPDKARQVRLEAEGSLVSEPIAREIEQSRGFQDLDADDFWNDWQRFKRGQ
ncbi:MAG TPA: hypothetical protein VMZ27_00795, partial [Candidatus Saccharimonadales bacterium]|nr:hypothetical protein [Candidatus Saccharimonadales bacterium]